MTMLFSHVLKCLFAVTLAVTTFSVVGCGETKEPATVPVDAPPLGTPSYDDGGGNTGKVNLPTE